MAPSTRRGRLAATIAATLGAALIPVVLTAAPAQAAAPDCSTQQSAVTAAQGDLDTATTALDQYRTDTIKPARVAYKQARIAFNEALADLRAATVALADAVDTYRANPTAATAQGVRDARAARVTTRAIYDAALADRAEKKGSLTAALDGALPLQDDIAAATANRDAAQQDLTSCQNPPSPRFQVSDGHYFPLTDSPSVTLTAIGLTPNTEYFINPETYCLSKGIDSGCGATLVTDAEGVLTTLAFGAGNFSLVSCQALVPTAQVRLYDANGLVIDEQVAVPQDVCP